MHLAEFNIILCWIAGHVGIYGNEIADQLAKNPGNGAMHIIKKDCGDIVNIVKGEVYSEWQRVWESSARTKGGHTFQIKPNVNTTPWFKKRLVVKRTYAATISRLRLGHGLFPAHMYRLGLRDSPTCNCGGYGCLNHIFFNCPNNGYARNLLFEALMQVGQFPPYNLTSLLATDDFSTMDILVGFLNKVDLHI